MEKGDEQLKIVHKHISQWTANNYVIHKDVADWHCRFWGQGSKDYRNENI